MQVLAGRSGNNEQGVPTFNIKQPSEFDKLPVLFHYFRPYNGRTNKVHRKSTAFVKLMMVFHPFTFKSGQILATPHHLPPVLK